MTRRDFKEILGKANDKMTRLGDLLLVIEDRYKSYLDPDEFTIRDISKEVLAESNPNLSEYEAEYIANSGKILVPGPLVPWSKEKSFKYKENFYFLIEVANLHTPRFVLYEYDKNDWTLKYKLADFTSRDSISNCEIKEELIDKIYVKHEYTVFVG